MTLLGRKKRIEKIRNARYIVVAALVLAMAAAVVVQLGRLQIGRGSEYASSSAAISTKTISLAGKRGSIYDANGVLLACDEESYQVTFYRPPGDNKSEARAAYSLSIYQTIQIIERNGDSVTDDFAVNRTDDGKWYLEFNTADEETRAKRESLWRGNFYVSDEEKYPVDGLFELLCRWYCVPEGLDYEMAHKIMSVWQEMQMNAYLGTPVTVASGVSYSTVAQISAAMSDLSGVDIAEQYGRVYPLDDVAAHVVGYMGKMQSNDIIKQFAALGYSSDDLIGITGVEATMEEELSANVTYRQGSMTVEKDTFGSVTDVLATVEPQDGNSVVLTMDTELQQVVYDALEKNIRTTRERQEAEYAADPARYDQLVAERGGKEISYAETGACVVLDVNTGNVLALVSYPSFSLDLFAGGISSEDYNALASDTRSPLYNKAISSRETPGSIFKMVTALAGLEEGVIQPSERIDDGGRYTKYDSTGGPKCWTNYPASHRNQTVLEAIKNSCNYFFYETADRLGIDALHSWAERLGLTSKTNIQLTGESTSVVGDPEHLYSVYRARVSDAVREMLTEVGEELGRTYDEERLDRVAMLLLGTVESYTATESLPVIRQILIDEMGLSSSEISGRYLVNQISEKLTTLRWTPTQTLMTGIGQSYTQLTPIAIARYVAALANGGTVYEANIVDRVIDPDGDTVYKNEPTVVSQLEGVQDSLDIIMKGMHGVTSEEDGGTAYKYFLNYEYTDQLGAKTGTAQVGKIDLENHSWFVALAPYDDPEIVVVVFIPNGYSGAYSYITIQETIQFYLDKKDTMPDESIHYSGQLLP